MLEHPITYTADLSVNRALAEELLSKLRSRPAHPAAPSRMGCARDTSLPGVGPRRCAWATARVGLSTTPMPAGMPASYAQRASSTRKPHANAIWRPG